MSPILNNTNDIFIRCQFVLSIDIEFESRSRLGVRQYVIKSVSDLRQVGGFLRILRFPPPIKLTTTDILLKVALNTIKQTHKQIYWRSYIHIYSQCDVATPEKVLRETNVSTRIITNSSLRQTSSYHSIERGSECCLTSREPFSSYTMARISYILLK